MRRDDPNGGGNSRKSMVQTLEGSLRRLGTDYVDLLWLHMWDGMTPVEEVVRALDDLVSAGKVLYVGFSDTPAWVVSQAVAIAELRGWARPVALQLPYSLADRDPERDLLPMARALDLAVTPWGTLEGGALTGKYLEDGDEPRRYGGVGERTNELAREVVSLVADELGVERVSGRDRVGARPAVAADPDRRRTHRGAAARQPRRARGRASGGGRRAAERGERLPAPASRATSSSPTTCAG